MLQFYYDFLDIYSLSPSWTLSFVGDVLYLTSSNRQDIVRDIQETWEDVSVVLADTFSHEPWESLPGQHISKWTGNLEEWKAEMFLSDFL